MRFKLQRCCLELEQKPPNQTLLEQLRLDDWDLVEEMLGRTLLAPSASSRRADDTTLLEAALLPGNSCIIKEVLKYDSTRYSPGALCAATFQTATAVVDPDIVYQLLRCRNPHSTSRESLRLETTAVGIAACYETPKILELLLSHIPVFHSSYFPSFRLDKISVRKTLEELLAKGKRPFWQDLPCERCSVLTYVLESTPNIMAKLLDQGYKFDWKTVTNTMRLHREEQYLDLISDQPILWYDENSTDRYGGYEYNAREALSVAIRSGNTNLFQSLWKIYKTVNSGKLGLGCSSGPLQVAIAVGNSEIFDTLIGAGISPHAPASDYAGMTALQAAAIYNRVGLAKRLIDLKVDINAPGARYHGRTALEGAAEHGHIDLIKLLLDSGVETNGPGQLQYLRAIGFALLHGHHVVADALKSHRKLTAEDLSILEGETLLYETYEFACAYSNCDLSSDEDGRESVGEDETSVICTEDAGLSQDENHQSLRIGGDETLLFHDEANGHNLDDFENFQLRRELSPVLNITAPSEGIYDFDYPLFGVYDMEDPIYENS
ncbi:ankyrin repeat-containing domain protein [Xylaria sp. FL0064]|nr:ankyrin repeat-containing domain protein [Xylaria sp. FL0064]